jgi:hypothetical protein
LFAFSGLFITFADYMGPKIISQVKKTNLKFEFLNIYYTKMEVCVCVCPAACRWTYKAITPKFGVGSSFHPGSEPS